MTVKIKETSLLDIKGVWHFPTTTETRSPFHSLDINVYITMLYGNGYQESRLHRHQINHKLDEIESEPTNWKMNSEI